MVRFPPAKIPPPTIGPDDDVARLLVTVTPSSVRPPPIFRIPPPPGPPVTPPVILRWIRCRDRAGVAVLLIPRGRNTSFPSKVAVGLPFSVSVLLVMMKFPTQVPFTRMVLLEEAASILAW